MDYGDGPMAGIPRAASIGAPAVVLTLGYSRESIRLLIRHSSAQTWAEFHERAFRRLGGTVLVIVLDSVKRASSRLNWRLIAPSAPRWPAA